jgi:hypothetical protein
MTGRLHALFDLLVPDERGRHATEETLDDWREERARARSFTAGVVVNTRGLAAILRVFAGIALNDMRTRHAWQPFVVALLAAGSLGLVLVVPADRPLLSGIGMPVDVVLLATLLPTCLPLLSFALAGGIGQRRDHQAPVLFTILASTLFLVIMSGWVVPITNQIFRERVLAFRVVPPANTPAPSTAELTVPELLKHAWDGTPLDRRNTLRTAISRLALVATAPTMLLLGLAIRRRLFRRWRVAQALGVLTAVGLHVVGGVATSMLRLSDWPLAAHLRSVGGGTWMSLALGWLMTWALLRFSGSFKPRAEA